MKGSREGRLHVLRTNVIVNRHNPITKRPYTRGERLL